MTKDKEKPTPADQSNNLLGKIHNRSESLFAEGDEAGIGDAKTIDREGGEHGVETFAGEFGGNGSDEGKAAIHGAANRT